MTLLMNLANACQLESKIAAMFRGDRINTSEKRSVLHTATRARVDDPPVWVKGHFDPSSSSAETTENAVRKEAVTRRTLGALRTTCTQRHPSTPSNARSLRGLYDVFSLLPLTNFCVALCTFSFLCAVLAVLFGLVLKDCPGARATGAHSSFLQCRARRCSRGRR